MAAPLGLPPAAGASLRSRRPGRAIRLALVWAALSAAVWLPPLRGGRALFGDALLKLFYPYAAFLKRSALALEVPFWNPHQLGGVPFAANLQSAVFYPPNWLHVPLGFPAAAAVGAWAHTALAGLFMSAWARRRGLSGPAAAASGAVFALNGFFVLHYAFPCQAAAYAWTPLAALCLEAAAGPRAAAWTAGAALALALQFLAGHPQFVLYSGAVLALLALCAEDRPRALGRLAAAGALAGGVAAVQLVPAWGLAAASPRAAGQGYEWAVQMSVAPAELLRMLLLPQWNSSWTPASGDPHIVGLYFGLPALGLAAWGLRAPGARPFALAAAAGLALALGRHLPGYRLLHDWVPGLALFRFPAQAAALACFGVAALAGLGLERLGGSARRRWALVSVCVLDLWLFSQRAIDTLDAEVYRAGTPLLAALSERGGLDRFMLTPRSQLEQSRPGRTPLEAWLAFKDTAVPNLATAYGLYDLFAYEELRLARTDEALHRLAQDSRSPWMDVLGARYVVSFWELPPDAFRLLGRSTALLYENPDAFPKAYFASGAECVPPGRALAAVEARPPRTLLSAPVLSGECAPSHAASSAPVRVASYRSGAVDLELDAPAPGWVVLTDAFAPGWRASVDGRPAEVVAANHVQRAVAVPAGARRVAFRYRPPHLGAALLVSLASLAACALALWSQRRLGLSG